MDVQFEDEKIMIDHIAQADRRSALVKFIMKLGIAKSEASANYIMLICALLFFGITLYVVTHFLL